MLSNAKICLYPRDPQEAVRILSEKGKQALLLAGGTTASLSKDKSVTTLVDLSRMDLEGIGNDDGKWWLDCGVRIQQVASHTGLRGLYDGMLPKAAASVGSRPIRNVVTVGGNAVQVFRWSDPPVAYLAMNALFDLVGPGSKRSLSADEFYERHPRRVLDAYELLTRIEIPEPQGAVGGAFIKFARTAFDLSIVDVAVCLGLEGRKCSWARIAIGGTRTLPWRSRKAESELAGSQPTARKIAEAAAVARDETRTSDDIRTSGEYRRQMVEVIAGRAIEQAVSHAKEKV